MHKDSMNIGLITFAWGPSDKGGLMTHVRGISESLEHLGHRIYIHCVNTSGKGTSFETKSWNEGNINVQEMNYGYQDAKSLLDFQRVPQAEIILENWTKHNKLDIIDFHHNLFFGIHSIKTLSKICPVVATLHDYWPVDPRGQLFSSDQSIISPSDHDLWTKSVLSTWPQETNQSLELLKYYKSHAAAHKETQGKDRSLKSCWSNYSNECLKFASSVITPSHESAKILKQHGISVDIQIIENGLDTTVFKGKLRKTNQQDSGSPISFAKKFHHLKALPKQDKIRVAILGTIAPHKGQLAFIKACLDERLLPKISIQLYGPLPDSYHGDQNSQEYLKHLAAEKSDFLTIRGAYNRSSLSEIFNESDIVAMPSIWQEVYGFVAREALAYGLPVITTNAGGLRDLENHEGTYILPIDEISSWSNLLNSAIKDGPLHQWVKQRRKGIPACDKKFKTVKECALDLSNLYQNIINSKQ